MTRVRPYTIAPAGAGGDRGPHRLGMAYGRLIYRLRWPVIALWAVALLISVPFAATLSSVLKGGGLELRDSESSRVADVLVAKLHQPRSVAVVVFQSAAVSAGAPAYRAELAAFERAAATFPHVTGVAPGGIGRDGRTAFVTVGFDRDDSYLEGRIPALRRVAARAAASGPARVYVTGQAATDVDVFAVAQSDLERREAIALPIALVVLVLVFASLVAATMPLLLALVAVPVALAVIYAIAAHSDTTIFVLNVASVVGLGIAIDYSLLMTRRFREELAAGHAVCEAVARTVATTGEAILFSGLTVMVGLSGLLLIGVQVLVSFGLGGAVVVGVAVLAALTLMPALLAVLGHRIDALPAPLLGRRRRRSAFAASGGFWHTLALGVMRRPVLVILAVTVWLLVLGRPIASMSLALFGATDLPPAAEAQHGQDLLRAEYPQLMLDPVEVVARTPDGSAMLAPGNLARLAGLTRWLAVRPHVTGVVGLLRPPAQPGQPPPDDGQLAALYAGGAYARTPALAQLAAATTSGDTTLITLATDTRLDGDQGKALIDALRAGDAAAGGGLVVSVGGIQAASLDLTRYIYGNFPRTVLLILAVTYVLLLLMFRSLLLPLKAVLTNLLSLGASYGVLVYVFQQGHLQRLLGFTSDGFLSATSPVLIFCILFGLSMDYEVFLLSRVREEWLRGGDNRDAVARGLEKTGGIITSAALLFAIVTGAFTFTTLLSTKELGLGMTVAVVVDAAVIRTLLVPATMRLLGRWNWWLPGQPLPLGAVRAAPASGGAPALGPAARATRPGPRVAPLPGLAAYLAAESLWAPAARGAPPPADATGAVTAGRVAIVTQVYWLPREAPDPAAKHPARRAAAPLRRAPVRRAPARR